MQKIVQKKNDACMDMLSFFKDKFKNKDMFVQMVNDVGINRLMDQQQNEEDGGEEEQENDGGEEGEEEIVEN